MRVMRPLWCSGATCNSLLRRPDEVEAPFVSASVSGRLMVRGRPGRRMTALVIDMSSRRDLREARCQREQVNAKQVNAKQVNREQVNAKQVNAKQLVLLVKRKWSRGSHCTNTPNLWTRGRHRGGGRRGHLALSPEAWPSDAAPRHKHHQVDPDSLPASKDRQRIMRGIPMSDAAAEPSLPHPPHRRFEPRLKNETQKGMDERMEGAYTEMPRPSAPQDEECQYRENGEGRDNLINTSHE
ncbi:hypothetical protein O3P69_010593 [Scylla paramamosain]|uniref:Uncharacterized protein n=1 Tax=Scylla paramamosain TaxID=85552 RepID=A0AAW0TF92_SCYPA